MGIDDYSDNNRVRQNDEILIPKTLDFKSFSNQDLFHDISSKTVFLDFSNCEFILPGGIIPVLLLSKSLSKNGTQLEIKGMSDNISSYLERMNFFEAISFDNLSPKPITRHSSQDRFIEIYNFSSLTDDKEVSDKYVEVINCVLKQMPSDVQIKAGRCFEVTISELVDNARSHSRAQECFLMAQNYPNLGYIELCVGDNGIGIDQSMNSNDIGEALVNVLNEDTKGPSSPGRGMGLYIVSKLIKDSNCSKSHFWLSSKNKHVDVSSNGLYLYNNASNFQGTLATLRIGYNISIDFEKSLKRDMELIGAYNDDIDSLFLNSP